MSSDSDVCQEEFYWNETDFCSLYEILREQATRMEALRSLGLTTEEVSQVTVHLQRCRMYKSDSRCIGTQHPPFWSRKIHF